MTTIAGFLLISPALCQYTMEMDMRPDVTFGDHNDRFDIGNIVEEQNHFENFLAANRRHRYKKERDDAMNLPEDDDESLRRSGLNRHYLQGRLFARRYSDTDFAYHDNMDSSEGGTVGDYNRALDDFQAQNGRRRFHNFVRYVHVKPKRSNFMKDTLRRSNKLSDLLKELKIPVTLSPKELKRAEG